MPVISRFYGMTIKMFFPQKEHNPPHIHVVYGEYIGVIDIKTLQMQQGDLPLKAYNIVKEWTKIHQEELLEMWNNGIIKELPPIV